MVERRFELQGNCAVNKSYSYLESKFIDSDILS